jgi:hypothetical protein
MIRRSFVLGAASVSLALAGCGGGGSSDPTPTPTPTSTATPSPTPVSYSSFPLTTNTEFGTVNAFTTFTGNLATGPITLGPAGTEIGSTRFRLAALADPTIASTATGGTPMVVRENLEEGRFNKDQLVTPPATTVPEFAFANTTVFKNGTETTILSSRAEFLNNTVKDKVTTDAGLALTRVSYTAWVRSDSATGETRITYGAWGYPTVGSDMPTNTATYSARIAGRVVGVTGGTGAITKLGGTVTITVNFGTGLVTVTANVTTIGAGGAETPYGTFSGNGAIASGATQFTGSFGPTSPVPGTFAGAFFGSQGEQLGITFAGSGTVGGTASNLVGVVVGKKN